MNLYCIKNFVQCSQEITILKEKAKIDAKINLSSCCNDCRFKKVPTIDKKE